MVITTSTAHVAHVVSPMIGYCRHRWLPIRWLGSQQQASVGPSEYVDQFILLDQYNKTFVHTMREFSWCVNFNCSNTHKYLL